MRTHQADPSRPASKRDAWLQRYEALSTFLDSQRRMPNQTFASPEERQLSSWVSTQRLAHQGLGTSSLTPEQTQQLEQLPGWHW
jgi:hypothetical protein